MENNIKVDGNILIGFENGSNTYGSYVKFSDGTMIQYGKTNIGSTTYAGQRLVATITMPTNFVNANNYVVTGSWYGNYVFSPGTYSTIGVYNGTKNAFTAFATTSETATTFIISWIAVGRWK